MSETQARIARALEAATARLEADERRRFEPIAIVGMGCRFPGADSLAAFWSLLRDGRTAVGPIPPERWNVNAHFSRDREAAGRSYARDGAFLRDVDLFDAGVFGISPREAESLDPQQRLLLEVTLEAFETGGLTRQALRGSRTGVFVGATRCDYGYLLTRALERLDSYAVTGNTLNAIAGRLSFVFGLRGPSMAVDTACSSSLVAVHLACQSLRAQECDAAVAAGVNLMLAPDGFVALAKAGVLSPDGRCRPFDAAANGIGRGEGCGVVVLKRLSDAERDGDAIAAVIRGSAVNQDGASGGLTVPNGPAQEDVVRRALEQARLTPDAVSYVEAHGTGTPLGDPIELGALSAVFGPGRSTDRPLLIGAVKGNIAHGEAAAGVAGVIKTVLSLQHQHIPPVAGFERPSPHVDWSAPIAIATGLMPWPAGDRPRIAGVSGFGVSGTNAHLVIAESPAAPSRPPIHTDLPATRVADERSHLVVVSAVDGRSLRVAAAQMATAIDRDEPAELRDLAFSTTTLRDHYAHRAAIVASSKPDAVTALAAVGDGRASAHARVGQSRPGHSGRPVFLFAGQGAQSSKMGAELYEREPAFRAAIDRCAVVLGHDPLRPATSIDDTAAAQPALFAFEYALAMLWQSWGVEPAAVAGHSVGEFVAATVAGLFSVEDGLRLVAERGRLMSALPRNGGMTAVLAAEPIVRSIVDRYADRLSIAALNAPEQVVLSGDLDALKLAVNELKQRGVAATPLTVSHAFHSPLMAPMVDAFRTIVQGIAFQTPRVPFYSALTGARVGSGAMTAEHWLRHILQPVRFADTLDALHRDGHRVFLEIAPHRTLTQIAKAGSERADTHWIASLHRKHDAPAALLLALGDLHVHGMAVDWVAVHAASGGRRMALPTYPFQRRRYWFAESAVDSAPTAVPGLHEIEWRDARLPVSRSAPSHWLILTDRAGVGEQLATAARAHGHDVSTRPATQAGLDAVVSRLAAAAPAATLEIVHLGSLDIADGTDWDEAQQLGVLSALRAVQAAAAGDGARVWVITRGAQCADEAAVCPLQAPVWGLGRTAALEHPAAWGGLIDLDPSATVDPTAILREIDAKLSDTQVAHRRGRRLVPRLRRSATPSPAPLAIAADRSYIVTGATGALGLLTAEWLVSAGARHVVLAARREAEPAIAARIAALAPHACLMVADVADPAAAARLVSIAEGLAPLRGVIHAAGAIADGVLGEQNPQRVAKVMAGKARGAFNLDALTRGRDLDFFVMFSSLASVLGSPGQGNYGAANAFLDTLAAARQQRGERACSINWGPWSDAGMAAGREAAMRARGLAPWHPDDAIRLLALVADGARSQVVAAVLDATAVRAAAPAARLSMLDELSPYATPAIELSPATVPTSHDGMTAYLCQRIAAVLRLADDRVLDRTASLQEQGLDSMMATELRNRMVRELAIDVPIASLLSGATIEVVADRVLQITALAQVAAPLAGADVEEIVL